MCRSSRSSCARTTARFRGDSVVVDLGASIGTFAIYAATSAPNVRVYAYEPMPDFFRLMQANISLNGLDASVTCFNMAVAGDGADRELFVAGAGLAFSNARVAVADDADSRLYACAAPMLARILDAQRAVARRHPEDGCRGRGV